MSTGAAHRRRYFVSGTDTGVGKTLVTAAMLHALNGRGLTTVGLKPVAAGAIETAAGWRNEDALMLQSYQSSTLSYQQINPVLLREPMAPHIAARREQRRVTINQLTGYCQGALLGAPDVALVEGAGGWRVPVNDTQYLSALPVALAMPVLLVVGVRLGCINQALLTAEAIQRDGLALQGWIANTIDPDMSAEQENIATLRAALPAPLLGTIPFLPDPSPEQVADFLGLSSLF